MDVSQPTTLYGERRLEIIRLYLLEGWKLEQIKLEFEQRQSGSEPRLTIDQWKSFLRTQAIFKNLSEEEVVFIKSRLGLTAGPWNCLILASDVLLDNLEVEKRYKRKRRHLQDFRPPNRRVLTFIPLHFDSLASVNPTLSKTSSDFCSVRGSTLRLPSTRADGRQMTRGLYARSAELRTGLTELSKLHNMVFDALKQFRMGRNDRAGALIRTAFLHPKSIVQNYHHRQFSDILAILLLLRRDGHYGFQQITDRISCLLGKTSLVSERAP